MPRQDTVDFLTAFAVGTVLGIGATLLLQPERPARARLVGKIRPFKRQMKRSYAQVRAGVRSGGEATGEITTDAIDAGKELLNEFRSEVAEILEGARAELREIAREQGGAQRPRRPRPERPRGEGTGRTRRKPGA